MGLILLQGAWFLALVLTTFVVGHFLFFFKEKVFQNLAIKFILGFCTISIATSLFLAGLTYTNVLLSAALIGFYLIPKIPAENLFFTKTRIFGLLILPVFAFLYFTIFSVKEGAFYVNFIDFSYYGIVAEGLVNNGVENTYAYLNSFNPDFFPTTQLYHFADLWVVGLLAKLSQLPAATLYISINCSFFLLVFFVFSFETLLNQNTNNFIDWWIAPLLIFSGVVLYYFSKGLWMTSNIVADPELKFLPSFVFMFIGLWNFQRNEAFTLFFLFLAAIFNVLFLPIFGCFFLRNTISTFISNNLRQPLFWISLIWIGLYGLGILWSANTYALQTSDASDVFSLFDAYKSFASFLLQSLFLIPYFSLLFLMGYLDRNKQSNREYWMFGSLIFLVYLVGAAVLYRDLQNFQLFFVARLFLIATTAALVLNKLAKIHFKIKVPALVILLIFATIPIQKTYAKWQRSHIHKMIEPHASFLNKHAIAQASLVFKSPNQYQGAHQLAVHAMDGIAAHLPYTKGNKGIVDLAIYHYTNMLDVEANVAYLNLNNFMGISQEISQEDWICKSLKFITQHQISSALVANDVAARATFNLLKPQLVMQDSMHIEEKFTLYYWDQVNTLCAE